MDRYDRFDFTNTPTSEQRPAFHYVPKDPSVKPAVSIVTAFFNTGSVFKETAQSVFNQSFQQWEWIIINDGSSDSEAQSVLNEYRGIDPRIRIIDLPDNLGPANAYNVGFQEAKTEYVVKLDSDDLLEPTAVEQWLWFMISFPEHAFVKGYSIGFGSQEYLWRRGFERNRAFLLENWVDSNCMIRKSVHKAVGGYDVSIQNGFEDWDFWLRSANHGFWGAIIPEFLNWYRRRPLNSRPWPTLKSPLKRHLFRVGLWKKYGKLFFRFPKIRRRTEGIYRSVPDDVPFPNQLDKKRNRILMVLPWMTMGGADKFNLDFIEQMIGAGYEVSICTTVNGPSPWVREFGSRTPDIMLLPNFIRLSDYPRFIRYMIESRRIDIVFISNSNLGYKLLPYLRSRCRGVTFVDYSHMEEENFLGGGFPRFATGYQNLLDCNIVSSNYLKNWMVKHGGDGDRIEVCHTNIDTEKWNPDLFETLNIRRSLGISEDVPLVIYAARFCYQKRPQLLVKIIRKMLHKKTDCVFLIVGNGELATYLKLSLWRQRKQKRVFLLKSVSNEKMRSLMAASDILLLPSLQEGIALTLFEAMASKTVPVSADVGGQRELVTPECGYLIPIGGDELNRYCTALKDLIENPEKCSSMANAARERVIEHFHINQMKTKMLDVLDRAKETTGQGNFPLFDDGLGREIAAMAIDHESMYRLFGNVYIMANRHNVVGKLIDLLKTYEFFVGRLYWTLHSMLDR